jgi:transposase
VICSLGDLSPRPKQQWLALARKLEAALSGQQELPLDDAPAADLTPLAEKLERGIQRRSPRSRQRMGDPLPIRDLIAVHSDRIRTEEHRAAGAVHVGLQFWHRLQMGQILQRAGLDARTCVLSCVMVLNRLIHPVSERAMPNWIRSTALADILQVDFRELSEDSLYRNLDKLYPARISIEAALAERERNLFNLDTTLYLYDLTSTYFEGKAQANPKAKRGYSRDGRPDCKQVVIGMAVNRDGFPLAHEVFAGNRHDATTLEEMLEALDRRVGLQPGQTVVVDRGLSGPDNLQAIRAKQLHYLVADHQSHRDQWLEEFENAADFQAVLRPCSPTNPFQKKSTVEVKLCRLDGETHILCLSSERKEKDRAIRQLHEKRLLADLEKLSRRVAKGKGRGTQPKEVLESIGRLKERYSRVARYYRMDYDIETKTFSYAVDEQKRASAERLDGSYLLKTDRDDLSAEEAWRIHVLLTRSEAAFRALKTPLEERPIFHHKQQRVETHIFLCVLAYHLLLSIEKTLLDQGVHTSWATVREALKTHQVCTVVLPTDDEMALRIRAASTPEPQHLELYRALDVPTEIMAPKKDWSQEAATPK